MGKQTEYQILTARSLATLQDMVNVYLEDEDANFKVVGPIVIVPPEWEHESREFAQAVVNEEETCTGKLNKEAK